MDSRRVSHTAKVSVRQLQVQRSGFIVLIANHQILQSHVIPSNAYGVRNIIGDIRVSHSHLPIINSQPPFGHRFGKLSPDMDSGVQVTRQFTEYTSGQGLNSAQLEVFHRKINIHGHGTGIPGGNIPLNIQVTLSSIFQVCIQVQSRVKLIPAPLNPQGTNRIVRHRDILNP